MTSLCRPFLTSLFCLVIATGHAPAWLHVANCGGHNHDSVVASSESNTAPDVCAHGCHHHASASNLDVDDSHIHEVSHGKSRDSQGDHDSDHCPICQSLASPCGVAWKLDGSIVAELSIQPVIFIAGTFFVSTSRSIAEQRGPPALA